MLTRKSSFVVIEMSITPKDVQHIKLTRSFLQVMCHYLYSVFKKFLRYRKKIFEDFILYDNGMEIQDSFIPYEYLISFRNDELLLLAKLEKDKIVPDDSILQVKFNRKYNTNILKSNLYYHLKYNTVRADMLHYKSVKVTL
jgi:hypothetical protein